MSDNPYTPPKTELSETLKAPKPPGSAFKAVVIGLAVDLGGTLLSSAVLAILLFLVLRAQGMDVSQIRHFAHNLPEFSWLWQLSVANGLCFSFLGGFVAARILQRWSLPASGVQGLLSALPSFVTSSIRAAGDPETLLVLACTALLIFLAVVFGTWLGSRRWEKNAPPVITASSE
jgi:hypothetical protein